MLHMKLTTYCVCAACNQELATKCIDQHKLDIENSVAPDRPKYELPPSEEELAKIRRQARRRRKTATAPPGKRSRRSEATTETTVPAPAAGGDDVGTSGGDDGEGSDSDSSCSSDSSDSSDSSSEDNDVESTSSDGAAPLRSSLGRDIHQRVSIQKCLRKFRRREQLDETDTWYCSSCKDHVRAFKKMQIWKLPEVLVLQLKRFSFSKRSTPAYCTSALFLWPDFHDMRCLSPSPWHNLCSLLL